MININKILDPVPLNNNQRRLMFAWNWREHFGKFPDLSPAVASQCRICHKPIWRKAEEIINALDHTCSDKCSAELEELRSENHWN